MNTDATSPPLADRGDAPPAADIGEDWPRAMIERQLWLLGELAEGGLQIAKAVERQAKRLVDGPEPGEDPPAQEVVRGNVVAAYARVARAVRLTILLQSKLLHELLEMEKQQARDASLAQISRPRQLQAQKPRITKIVTRIARAEHEDGETVERLRAEAAERLDHDDIYGDILTRPASEIIDRICRDLGLSPDWPRLAQEAWAQEELRTRHPGAPLAAVRAATWDARRPFASSESPKRSRPPPLAERGGEGEVVERAASSTTMDTAFLRSIP